MDMTLVIILIVLLLIAFFIIYDVSTSKLQERHNAVLRRLVELEEKEIQNGIMREDFHMMKKYFEKFHPECLRK